jgi:hypothetical protein
MKTVWENFVTTNTICRNNCSYTVSAKKQKQKNSQEKVAGMGTETIVVFFQPHLRTLKVA